MRIFATNNFSGVFCIGSFQVAKEFFPDVAVGFEDPRVNLHIGDGMWPKLTSVVC